jgi:hypothetical protein
MLLLACALAAPSTAGQSPPGPQGEEQEVQEGAQAGVAAPDEAATVTQEEPFSRSRWIREHRLPYPGIPHPLSPMPPPPVPVLPDFSLLAGLRAFVDPAVVGPVRVNNDVLPPGNATNPWSQAEPDIAVNPFDDDNIVAVYQESRFRDGGARALNFATSLDGGLTWVEGSLPQLTQELGGPWERASDPWVAFGPENRVYYVSLDFNETDPANQVGVSVSRDGGITWGAPVSVFRSELDFNDKEAIEVDTYPESPHFGNVYVSWDINIAQGDGFAAQHLVVARSTDGGGSYRPPVVLRTAGGNIGAIPRVGPEGTVYVAWAGTISGGTWAIFFAASDDGGATFSTPRPVQTLSSLSVPYIRDGSILPSLAVDRNSGDLYLVWADARWTGVDQTTMSYSRDQGVTWSAPRRVSSGPGDAPTFTAAVAVNGRGEVAVSYTSLENDPARSFAVDQYVSISRDRGVSFTARRRLSPVTSDIRWAAWAREYFLGDYTGIAAGSRAFHMLWVFPLLPSPTVVPPPTDPVLGLDPPAGLDAPLPVAPVRLQSDVFYSRTR